MFDVERIKYQDSFSLHVLPCYTWRGELYFNHDLFASLCLRLTFKSRSCAGHKRQERNAGLWRAARGRRHRGSAPCSAPCFRAKRVLCVLSGALSDIVRTLPTMLLTRQTKAGRERRPELAEPFIVVTYCGPVSCRVSCQSGD